MDREHQAPVDDQELARLERELDAARRDLQRTREALLDLRAGSADARRMLEGPRPRGRAFRRGLGAGLGVGVLLLGAGTCRIVAAIGWSGAVLAAGNVLMVATVALSPSFRGLFKGRLG